VWSVQTVSLGAWTGGFSLSWRFSFWSPDGRNLVVRIGSGYVRTRTTTNGRTVRTNRPEAHDLSAWFRGRTRPDDINSPSEQGLHRGYIYPGRRLSSLPHQNLTFWLLMSYFLSVFGFISSLLSFCTLFSHSRYFPIFFFFSSVYFKLLECWFLSECFWDYEMNIFAMLGLFVGL
jgi:hypothetical protein